MTRPPFPRKGAKGSLAPKYHLDGLPVYRSLEGALGAALRTALASQAPAVVWVNGSGARDERRHVVTVETQPLDGLPPAPGSPWERLCTVQPAGAGLES
jgi:hypothetical protein